MYFEGKKLSKKDFTYKLGKRLAMRHKVRYEAKHHERAEKLVSDGVYDEYLKQFKTKKKRTED